VVLSKLYLTIMTIRIINQGTCPAGSRILWWHYISEWISLHFN